MSRPASALMNTGASVGSHTLITISTMPSNITAIGVSRLTTGARSYTKRGNIVDHPATGGGLKTAIVGARTAIGMTTIMNTTATESFEGLRKGHSSLRGYTAGQL